MLPQVKDIYTSLSRLVGKSNVIGDDAGLRVYETDGLSVYRQKPLAVVLPQTTEHVAALLKYCEAEKLKLVPRGAGTSLSGGAIPVENGIVIGLSKMNKILEVDLDNNCAIVQPGVTNLSISQAVSEAGFYYAPDPSSQLACTIGGNVAENAGGVHCLKYGVTSNNLLGLTFVTIEGEIIKLGGKAPECPGYDLMGLITGSEGLLGIVTEIMVKLRRKPEAARGFLVGFDGIEKAGRAVGAIIGAGIIPAGMELMDHLSINAVEDFLHCQYPREAQALLLVELDGIAAEIDEQTGIIREICKKEGATSIRVSENEAERQKMWAGRKAAFPAIGKMAPDYFCMDGTIPRRELPKILSFIHELSKEYGLAIANVFHAGDGNLHPLIMFDSHQEGQLEKAEELGAAILRRCVELGGVLSGEHGIGIEKRDLMTKQFAPNDLDQQWRIKCAFDPDTLLNPGKVFPTLAKCADHGWTRLSQSEDRPFAHLPSF